MIRTHYKDGTIKDGAPESMAFNIRKPYIDIPVVPDIIMVDTPLDHSEVKKIRYIYDHAEREIVEGFPKNWEWTPERCKYIYLREDFAKRLGRV